MTGFGSKTGPLALFIAFMLPMGALASCGGAGAPANDGGEEQAGQAEEAATPSTERDDGASSETTVAAAGVQRTGTGDGGEVAVMRDGVWQVGDAGEIEFRFENGTLSLIGTRANSGWEVEIDEQEADEIEVDFGRENVEWDFDVEAEGNVLRVEMTQQIDDAEAGIYGVGDAGEVEFGLENGRLILVENRPNEGWDARVGEESDDEIEIDFVRGNVEWQFEAELDDDEVQVEIDQRISGPVAN